MGKNEIPQTSFKALQHELMKTEKMGKLTGKTSFKIGFRTAVIARISGFLLILLFAWGDWIALTHPTDWYNYLIAIPLFLFLHLVFIPPVFLQDFGYREISIYEKGIGLPKISGEFTTWITKIKFEWAVPYEAIKKVQRVYIVGDGEKNFEKVVIYYRFWEKSENLDKLKLKPSHGEELLRLIKPLMGERFDEILEEKVIEK